MTSRSQAAERPAEDDAVWESAPSPCIDVCKYKRQGRCIGCWMTKAEKESFPHHGGADAKREFIEALIARIAESGRNPAFWAYTYQHKCKREGVPCPVEVAEE